MILLDTHIWLWWLFGDGNLKPREREALDQLAGSGELALSWVSAWEAEMLERKGRITIYSPFKHWITEATSERFLTVLPADITLVASQRLLPKSFHGDPADRLITTSALLSGYPLATHDSRIRGSGVCEIWQLA